MNCLGLVQEYGGIRRQDDLEFGGAQETVRREIQMELSTQRQRDSANIGNGMSQIPTQDSIEEESQRENMSAKDCNQPTERDPEEIRNGSMGAKDRESR